MPRPAPHATGASAADAMARYRSALRGEPTGPRETWRAGVTPNHADYRVLLNGEPVVNAVAAKAGARGWVEVLPPLHLTKVKPSRSCPLGLAYQTNPLAGGNERLAGVVRVVRDTSDGW